MTDLISRQAAIDALVNTVSEIGLHDNSEVARYGATFRQHEIKDIIEKLPSAQPEPIKINIEDFNKEDWERLKKEWENTPITVLPSVQPEPSIPLSWVEKYIEWLKRFDNEFANLEAAHISVMVKKWRDEQNERFD